MAPTIGLRGGLRIVGFAGLFVGLLVVLPLAILAPVAGAFGLGVLGLLVALCAAFVLHARAARLAAAQDKLSAEIGLLSQRLLKAESAAAAVARAGSARPAAPSEAPGRAASDAEVLAAGIEEVTAEIGLLSGIVRELAAVVAAQDGEIARLRSDLKAATEPVEPQPGGAHRPASAADPAPRREAPAAPPSERAAASRTVPVRPTAREPAPEPTQVAAPVAAPLQKPAAFAPPVAPAPSHDAVIIEAFDGEGLEVWLQPVVTLPQRKVVSYEALARLKLGTEMLTPDLFLPVLERHGRTTALDRRMIRRTATIARHLQRRGSSASVAYALSPLSLFEPDFLRSLAGIVADEADPARDLAGRITVLLPQASWRSLDAEQKAVLKALRGRVGFGLDRPTDLRFDAGLLAERGVAQIKAPAALLLRPPSREAMPDIALEDLVTALGRAGIRLVATGIEREGEVPDLIDLDVPLAQGTVFAAPKAVRAEVFSQPAPPAAPAPPADPEPDPPPQRRAFRDFLRRAV